MYIEKLHIDTFGKLSDLDIELSPDVNIIEGANESGKSTIAAFIKFILYGVPSRERAQIMSWQTGGAAGSITVSDGGKRYRIERALVGAREAVQLIDGDTNMPIRGVLDGTTPGALFFGVEADMFAATAFVSQLGGTMLGGAKVSEGIENILFSADESVNTQRAAAKLDSARAALLHKNEKGGKLFEITEECAAMEVRLSDALQVHDDILAKESQLADMRAKLDGAEQKSNELGRRVEQFESRVLLGLFERKRGLESQVARLREKLEKDGDSEVEAISRLESQINKLEMLSREVEETAERVKSDDDSPADPSLEEYMARGGREALEEELQLCRTRSKTYAIVGIIVLVLGFIAAAIGAFPMMMSGAPQLLLLVGGAGLAALAITLFILGTGARNRAESIELAYDFDELDAAISKQASLRESAALAALAADTARKRYDNECDEIRGEYGCDPKELTLKLEDLKRKSRLRDGLRSEYDKQQTLLSQMREQLKPYSEAALREKLDEGVDISEVEASDLPEMRREAEFSAKMAESLKKHCAELEKTLAGLYPICEDPTKLSDKLAQLKLQRETLRKKHAAYKLACEKITEASENLRESVAPRLAADAAALMAHITGGKYREIGVGADLTMSAQTECGVKPLEVLSAGTQDAAYLCLRMSLISLLYRKTVPPMIYDEAFGRQDDKRLENLLKLIRIREGQSIIFTSNGREADAMRRLGDFELIQI